MKTFQECLDEQRKNYPRIADLVISSTEADNGILGTNHTVSAYKLVAGICWGQDTQNENYVWNAAGRVLEELERQYLEGKLC